MLDEIPRAHRHAMAAPLVSQWYPEETMQHSLAAASRVLARGNRDRMIEVLEGCTEIGVNTFFRIALRITTTPFALKAAAATWPLVRRGPGRMTVTVTGHRATIEYTHFPYFDDVNYRLLVLGTIGPLLRLSTGKTAQVEIVSWTRDSLRAHVSFP
jgi:hypothetical protein